MANIDTLKRTPRERAGSLLAEESSINTHVERRGEVSILVVTGDIDFATSAAFKAAILAELADKPAALVIDLRAVTFFSSAGVSALLTTRDTVANGTRFAVVADGPVTGRILALLGVCDWLCVHKTLQAAVAVVGS